MEILMIGLAIGVGMLFSQLKNLKEKLAKQEKSLSQLEDKLDTILQRSITNEAVLTSLRESYKLLLAVKGTAIENAVALSTVELEKQIEQPFKNLSKRKKKWLMIRGGMNKDLVKTILGAPFDPDNADDLWSYDDGSVNFDEDSGLVGQYDFNLQRGHYRDADLSQWSKIRKDLTTKRQVIAYLGNPYQVSIEYEAEGELTETWTYFSATHLGSLRFEDNGRLYNISLNTYEEVEKNAKEVMERLKLDKVDENAPN